MDKPINAVLAANKQGSDDGVNGRPMRDQEAFTIPEWHAYCHGYEQGQRMARLKKIAVPEE